MTKKYILERMREPSTWRGVALLAAASGITVAPAMWEHIAAIGMAISGLIGMLAPERSA
jgi:hypothetical protein